MVFVASDMWYLLLASLRVDATDLLKGNQTVKNNLGKSTRIWKMLTAVWLSEVIKNADDLGLSEKK